MNISLDREIVEYLSREKGIDPAFIEKDWHAVRVLHALSVYAHDGVTIVFTGGTSLSKGHGLLKRFSEDLDFRARFDAGKPPGRSHRRAFRNGIIETLKGIEGIVLKEDDLVVDGLGFKIRLTYPRLFSAPEGIRPELQIEFSYTQPRLDTECRVITSFIAQYKGDPAETSLHCLSPLEIAADKFSSLIWRVHKRDRTSAKDDPAMLRHLHDLCALREAVGEAQNIFVASARESFAVDQRQKNRQLSMPLSKAAMHAITVLQEDALYREEYQQFVDAMSYASDSEKITFEEALGHFKSKGFYLTPGAMLLIYDDNNINTFSLFFGRPYSNNHTQQQRQGDIA